MSNCINNCKICSKLIFSNAINFDTTTNTLIVDLPQRNYNNCECYCIVLVQSIPLSTTINAPVVFSIGGGATQYSFVNCDCTPIYASQVRTRTKYKVRVSTAVNDGVFKYIGDCCLPNNATTVAQSIPVSTTPTPATTQVNTVQQVNTTARK